MTTVTCASTAYALSLAVLDLLDAAEQPLPPVLVVPNSEAPALQQLRQAIQAAFARTSDKEKIAYLKRLLYQQPALIIDFLDAFKFSLPLLLAAAPAAHRSDALPHFRANRGGYIAHCFFSRLTAVPTALRLAAGGRDGGCQAE